MRVGRRLLFLLPSGNQLHRVLVAGDPLLAAVGQFAERVFVEVLARLPRRARNLRDRHVNKFLNQVPSTQITRREQIP